MAHLSSNLNRLQRRLLVPTRRLQQPSGHSLLPAFLVRPSRPVPARLRLSVPGFTRSALLLLTLLILFLIPLHPPSITYTHPPTHPPAHTHLLTLQLAPHPTTNSLPTCDSARPPWREAAPCLTRTATALGELTQDNNLIYRARRNLARRCAVTSRPTLFKSHSIGPGEPTCASSPADPPCCRTRTGTNSCCSAQAPEKRAQPVQPLLFRPRAPSMACREVD